MELGTTTPPLYLRAKTSVESSLPMSDIKFHIMPPIGGPCQGIVPTLTAFLKTCVSSQWV